MRGQRRQRRGEESQLQGPCSSVSIYTVFHTHFQVPSVKDQVMLGVPAQISKRHLELGLRQRAGTECFKGDEFGKGRKGPFCHQGQRMPCSPVPQVDSRDCR